MKKIFTLLVCTTLLSAAAFADDGHHGSHDRNDRYAYRDGDRDQRFDRDEFRGDHDRGEGFFGHVNVQVRPADNTYFTYQNYRYGFDQREAVTARISAYYDNQIEQVMDNWSLNRWEKRDAINNLQAQKSAEINRIYDQCGNGNPYSGQ